MPLISLIDETFNSLNSEHYKLTLQILPDGYSYTMLDSVRKKYVLLKHFKISNSENSLNEIISLINNDELLKLKFENSRAFIFTNKVTIFPNSFSQKDKISHFTNFNFGESNNSEDFVCKSSFDSNMAFSIPNSIKEVLSSINCTLFFPHAITVILEAQKECLQKESVSGIYLNLLNNNAQIVVIKDNKLQLFNIFPFQTDEDLCYFMVYLFDLFKFDKENIPVTVSGIIQKNDSRITKLEQFIKKIQYSKSSSQYIYSYRFNEIPQHHFSNLFIMPYEDNKW